MHPSFWLVTLLGLAADPPKPIEVNVPKRSAPVSYAKDVADLLDAKCAGCHGAALAENKLNMETVAGMLKGGKRGPSIRPGKADESLLFKMAAHRVEPVMPPKDKKDLKPLTPEELGLLKLWIDAGAKDDSDASPAPAKPVELGTLPPGVHPINALDLTADGRRVASGRANVVEVSDVDSGAPIIKLGGHRDLIQSVRYSADARRLAAGSFQVVTLWNAPTATLERTFSGSPEPIKALVATRDGKTLVTGGPGKAVRFWNAADGKTFKTTDLPAGTSALAFSTDESLLAAAGTDHVVRILSVKDGKEAHALKGHTAGVAAVAFLPDGKGLVTAGLDGTARIWTLPAKASESIPCRVVEVGRKGPIRALVLLPDGSAFLTAGDEGVVRWFSVADGKETRSLLVAGGATHALALAPDGKGLLVGPADGVVRFYESGWAGLRVASRPLRGPIAAVAFSPDGRRALAGGPDGAVMDWDLGGDWINVYSAPPLNAAGNGPAVETILVLRDGRAVVATDKVARIWACTGAWSEARTFGPHAFRVLAIDFSPDGTLMATGGGEPSRSGEVKIWDVATGKLVRGLDNLHSDTVFALRFSPDGKRLATASADKFLKVVNVADGKELKSFEGHTHHVLAVDWSGDGKRLATGGADSAVKIWDFESGEVVRTLNGSGKAVTSIRWVPGKALVIGGSGDGSARAWNPDNGSVARTFSAGDDYLYAVAASADGGRVAAGGAEGTLHLWNGTNGQALRIAPAAPPGMKR